MFARFASGNNADLVATSVAMTHNQHSHVCAQTKQDETVFIDRMFRVLDQTGKVVQKNRGRFAEVDAMFAPIRRRFRLVP